MSIEKSDVFRKKFLTLKTKPKVFELFELKLLSILCRVLTKRLTDKRAHRQKGLQTKGPKTQTKGPQTKRPKKQAEGPK